MGEPFASAFRFACLPWMGGAAPNTHGAANEPPHWLWGIRAQRHVGAKRAGCTLTLPTVTEKPLLFALWWVLGRGAPP